MYYRRLPLEGLHNARELGGHPIAGGGITKFRSFIRCELPERLTTGDLEFLKSYGVTDSVDFRGDSEVLEHPSCFERTPWVNYHRCPTFDKQVAFASKSAVDDDQPPFSDTIDWGEKYIELAQTGRDWVRDTLKTMSQAPGAVMFNCTTGKDRTGVISALLLGIAGVCEQDIAADYCISELYLEEKYNELLADYLARWPDDTTTKDSQFFKTKPASMLAFVRFINNKYDNIENYVKDCGVTENEISLLRRKLCEA